MKRLLFPLLLLFFLLPLDNATAGQWYTSICSNQGGYTGIPGASVANITDPEAGIPEGAEALPCQYRTGYAIGNNYSKKFFGIVQNSKLKNKSSLTWEWEDLPDRTLFDLPTFVPGKFYMRARNGVRPCLWVKTDFFEDYAWSCLSKKGIVSSSRFGPLIKSSHGVKVKKNNKGKIISRAGYFDIVSGNLQKVNDEVYGDKSLNISFALGIHCVSKQGCSAKDTPQIIWSQLNFLNKEDKAPYINPAGYAAIEFPDTPDPEPLVRVATNNANSLAGELKCPIESGPNCISTYGSQIIGATDQPLYDTGAGIYSLTLANNKTGSEDGPFAEATVNGNNSLWSTASSGSYLFENCTSSGFVSVCQAPEWGILNFEIRSLINEQSYNLNGSNRLQVCAYDRKESSDGTNQPGLKTCVAADQSFILDNEPPSGNITLPGSGSYSGTVTFRAQAEDEALGVASVQFRVQETDSSGNPIASAVDVGPLLDTPTAPGVSGTYETAVDTTTLANGTYRILALVKDKEARTLGSFSPASYSTTTSSTYLIDINN